MRQKINLFCLFTHCFVLEVETMTDQNRGIMKFRGADSTPVIVLSACLILGGITFLILWALQVAYIID
jgi:hypothetical protein